MQDDEKSKVPVRELVVGTGLIVLVIAGGLLAGAGLLQLGVGLAPAALLGCVASGCIAFVIAFFAPRSLGRGVSALVAALSLGNV